MSRTYLTANQDYYVSATGNDTTGDGSSINPWATISKTYTYAQRNLDLSGQWSVTCYLQSTYTGNDVIEGQLVGALGPQSFLIRGTSADQNRMFSGSIYAQNGAQCRIRYMQVQPTVGTSVTVSDGVIEFGDININTYGSGPMFDAAGPRAKIRAVGPCTLVGVGSCRNVFVAEDHSQIELPQAFYIAGAPTWTGSFCQGDLGGMIDGTGFSYLGGYPTGPRFCASLGGIVFTGLGGVGGGPNFFPGSSPGSYATGYYQ